MKKALLATALLALTPSAYAEDGFGEYNGGGTTSRTHSRGNSAQTQRALIIFAQTLGELGRNMQEHQRAMTGSNRNRSIQCSSQWRGRHLHTNCR